MTQYEYVYASFEKDTETIDIPDEAVGVSVHTLLDLVIVEYLVPVEDGGSA